MVDTLDIRFSIKDYFSGINHYSTTQTSDVVYIIGGRYTLNIVAEFKENVWRRLADLKQGRYGHSSIMVGGDSIIIGGHLSVLSVIIYHFTI